MTCREAPRTHPCQLGQPLFERRGRGIVLTAFGRYLAARATAILDHVASVLADSKRWSSEC